MRCQIPKELDVVFIVVNSTKNSIGSLIGSKQIIKGNKMNIEVNKELSDTLRSLMEPQSTAVQIDSSNWVYIGDMYENVYGTDSLTVLHIFDEGAYCKVTGTDAIMLVDPMELGRHKAVGNELLRNSILDNEYLLEFSYGYSHE